MKRRFWSVMAMVIALAFFGCDNGGSVGAIEMVRIPAGTFTMGDVNPESWGAQPPHTVTLTSGFYMGIHEVTQGQFESVMGFNPSWFTAERAGHDTSNFPVETVKWYYAIMFSNRLSIREGLRPAYEIRAAAGGQWTTNPDLWGEVPTWRSDARTLARWNAVRIVSDSNGYRLPTEAQWEYAARAGTTTPWSTGHSITQEQANFWLRWDGNNLNRPSEVGSFPPNAWGLYDMHGNVWEWVWDWWGGYTAGAKTDPLGASSGTHRVYRGGSWGVLTQAMRSAYRNGGRPDGNWNRYLGFRVVRP